MLYQWNGSTIINLRSIVLARKQLCKNLNGVNRAGLPTASILLFCCHTHNMLVVFCMTLKVVSLLCTFLFLFRHVQNNMLYNLLCLGARDIMVWRLEWSRTVGYDTISAAIKYRKRRLYNAWSAREDVDLMVATTSGSGRPLSYHYKCQQGKLLSWPTGFTCVGAMVKLWHSIGHSDAD